MYAHRPQTAAFLRFLNGLPKGYIFTTRDLIPFAPRSTLDSALSRLVKNGTLERLARGVFRFHDAKNRKVSVRQIAAVKRRAFGRKIATVATAIDRERLERLDDRGRELLKPSSTTLVSDGRTSSFLFHQDGSRINLKSVAMRINRLGESSAGRMLRDLWLLGDDLATTKDVVDAWSHLTPKEVAKVPALKRLLPNWLVEMLPPTPPRCIEQLMIRPIKKKVFIKPRKKPENTDPIAQQQQQQQQQQSEEQDKEKDLSIGDTDVTNSGHDAVDKGHDAVDKGHADPMPEHDAETQQNTEDFDSDTPD